MRRPLIRIAAIILLPFLAAAQNPAPQPQSPDQTNPQTQDMMNMPGMNMNMPSRADWIPSAHISSGMGWQPAVTQAHVWMRSFDGWDVMAHGVIFVDYNQQGGPRGEGKAESVNWLMLMQQHAAAGGTVLFREMLSAESLTSPHPGFPELFETGETYHSEPLVDHQHPHNVFGELALDFTHSVGDRVCWLFYGGAVGEPALGPVTYLSGNGHDRLPNPPCHVQSLCRQRR